MMKLRPTHGMDPPQPGDGCKEEMSNNPVMWKRNSIHNTFEKVAHKAIWIAPLLINNAHATGPGTRLGSPDPNQGYPNLQILKSLCYVLNVKFFPQVHWSEYLVPS